MTHRWIRGVGLLIVLCVAFALLVRALSPPGGHGVLVLAASMAVFKLMNRFEMPPATRAQD